jgi:hypothetical protein
MSEYLAAASYAAYFSGYRKALTELLQVIQSAAPTGSGPVTRGEGLGFVEQWAVRRLEDLKKGQTPQSRRRKPR